MRLSLMTRNYNVNISLLAQKLKQLGYENKAQEKYLEVPVRTIEEAKQVLRVFMGWIPERERVEIG